jgi:allantoin racemase
VPVVDATVAPFKFAELLADLAELGWRPSKIGGFATPSRDELESFGLAAQLATSPLAETVANPGR